MKKTIVFIILFLIFAVQGVSVSGQQLTPVPATEVIETLNGTLLECMKNGDELGYSGRYTLLEPVMIRSFFFPYMLMKSCGTYWRDMEPEQQTQLLEKYIAWSVGTYASRFKDYDDQDFLVISSERVRKKYVKVISHIVKKNKIRKFDYLLLENDGTWRIVDIQVEGVSQLSLTRSQFKSVLKDKGIEGLLAVLDEKIEALKLDNNG